VPARRLFRRFLVLAALMFWQGGFVFYASVVVPIGQQVLASHFHQGLITRRVTNFLNLAGAIALLPMAWDAISSTDRSRYRSWRWLSWLVMFLALGVLVWLHQLMDELVDVNSMQLFDQKLFRSEHRAYLWVSTAQWASSSLYAVLTLYAWSNEDRFGDKIPES
jgi:hypothetical protein